MTAKESKGPAQEYTEEPDHYCGHAQFIHGILFAVVRDFAFDRPPKDARLSGMRLYYQIARNQVFLSCPRVSAGPEKCSHALGKAQTGPNSGELPINRRASRRSVR